MNVRPHARGNANGFIVAIHVGATALANGFGHHVKKRKKSVLVALIAYGIGWKRIAHVNRPEIASVLGKMIRGIVRTHALHVTIASAFGQRLGELLATTILLRERQVALHLLGHVPI